METATNHQSQLNIHCDPATRQLLDQAAAYTHVSVGEFVLEQARLSAVQIVQNHGTITLTRDDFQAFLAALDAPPQPNPALERAFQRHAERILA
jgi:uncharacterized protein (DUF1778 family)